jgi:hypothetical protein
MSWSVSAVGKPGPVAKKLAADFAGCSYLKGAEVSIKDKAAELVAAALSAFTSPSAVKVSASGSKASTGLDGAIVEQHTLSIDIQPIWGFVE